MDMTQMLSAMTCVFNRQNFGGRWI